MKQIYLDKKISKKDIDFFGLNICHIIYEKNKHSLFYLVKTKTDNQIIGIVGYVKRGDEKYMQIYIEKEFRRLGYGRKTLILFLKKLKEDNDLNNIVAMIDRKNKTSLNLFYEFFNIKQFKLQYAKSK